MEGTLKMLKISEEYRAGRLMLVCMAVLGIACVWKWKISGKTLAAYIFLFLSMAAAWKDIQMKRIPDIIVLGMAAAGILSIPFFPEIGLAERGIGMLCVSVLLLFIALAVQGSFGGGDIKLMAASGIFLGWESNLGAFALAVLAAGGWCVWKLFRKQLNRKEQIAFGPFLCAGIAAEVFLSF